MTKYWWIGLLIVGGWFWLRDRDERIRQQVLAEERATYLKERAKELANVQLHVRELNARADSLEEMNKQSRARELQARNSIIGTVQHLRETMTAEQQVQLDSIIKGYEGIITEKDRQIAAANRLVADQQNELNVADSTLNATRGVLTETQVELDKAIKRSNQGLSTVEKAGVVVLIIAAIVK